MQNEDSSVCAWEEVVTKIHKSSLKENNLSDNVDQLTAKWVKLNCAYEVGSVVPRGELYASYVDDLRHRYSALSGSVQTFTNILRAVFPNVVLRLQSSSANSLPVFENIKMCKPHSNTCNHESPLASTNTCAHTSLVANHPLVQKMLADNMNTPTILNGHAIALVASAPVIDTNVPKEAIASTRTNLPASNFSEGSTRSSFLSVTSVQPATSLSPGQQVQTQLIAKSVVVKCLNGEKHSANNESVENGFGSSELTQFRVVGQVSNGNPPSNFHETCDETQMIQQPSTSTMTTVRDYCSASFVSDSPVSLKRRKVSVCTNTSPTTSTANVENYLCEWNGCGRHFSSACFVLYHCTKEHLHESRSMQCRWPRCDSTVRTKWSMVTHLQDHHCSEEALKTAARKRSEGSGVSLKPVSPERPREAVQHPGYSKNAAVEAIRRHAFNYLPRDITDDPEGPVTKSIRLTSCLILRNLARYSNDARRLLRRHESLLSWLSLSRVESSSALAQLLAELYSQPHSRRSSPHRPTSVPTALDAVKVSKAL
ncbi:unnamed protein product [Thelazia callipaeda]|uniref:RFX-type winged-helix domain-containing protein n=1 Tax=Thelazia callipaeda TaxID=103827 RepID=A0A0N5CJY9_THECL|nr:unnamed protein product [Thelazia callipaeda]